VENYYTYMMKFPVKNKNKIFALTNEYKQEETHSERLHMDRGGRRGGRQ
jgi:hypothetical protein